jgi:hypothetical protein
MAAEGGFIYNLRKEWRLALRDVESVIEHLP